MLKKSKTRALKKVNEPHFFDGRVVSCEKILRAMAIKGKIFDFKGKWGDDIELVLAYCRQMLIAACKIGKPTTSSPSALRIHFKRLEAKADKLLGALGTFSVVPDGMRRTQNEEIIELRALVQISASQTGKKLDKRQATKIAEVGLAALKTIKKLAMDIQQVSAILRAEHAELARLPQYQGNPPKRRFVYTIMEGWIILTGSSPSHTNRIFVDFLDAAWVGAFPNIAGDQDWVQSIRSQAKNFPDTRIRILKSLEPGRLLG